MAAEATDGAEDSGGTHHPEQMPISAPRTSGEVESTFRTLPSLVLGWVVIAGGALIAISFAFTGLNEEALTPVALCLVFTAGSWIALVRPSVVLKSDGVLLRNLVTDVDVPFTHLSAVGSKWALELVDTGGTTHSSWAIPARKGIRSQLRDDKDAAIDRSGQLGNNAAAVAGVIADRWDDWREAGGRGVTTEVGVKRIPAVPAIAPLSVAVLLLIAAIVF